MPEMPIYPTEIVDINSLDNCVGAYWTDKIDRLDEGGTYSSQAYITVNGSNIQSIVGIPSLYIGSGNGQQVGFAMAIWPIPRKGLTKLTLTSYSENRINNARGYQALHIDLLGLG